MPVHSESSTTTKCRAVFDASALSTNKISLNDMLAVGPTLHPTLDHILLKFRGYAVAITADITKMFYCTQRTGHSIDICGDQI